MIPKNLVLHNFMSYGPDNERLDFSGFDLACLSGPNGAGKSSLLEAITWALWGKARTFSDDDLVHLGEDEMWVDFTFGLGESTYRIIRKRKKGKQSDLQLLSLIGENFEPLSEATLRATQEKIDKALHLSYETFINSAFIRQGKADEFTAKKPADRKAILADILLLSFYDSLEREAKNKVREKEIERESLEFYLGESQKEIENKKKYLNEWKNLDKEAKKLKIDLDSQEKLISKLKEEEAHLGVAGEKAKELENFILERKKEISEFKYELDEIENKMAEVQKIILRKSEIERGCDKKKKLVLEENLKKINLEIEKLKTLNESIKKEGEELKEKINFLSVASAKCPLCEQKLDEVHRKEVQEKLEKEIAQKRNVYSKNEKDILNLENEKQELEERLIREVQKLENYQALKEKLSQSLVLIDNYKKNKEKIKEATQKKEKEIKIKSSELACLKTSLLKLSQLGNKIMDESRKLDELKFKNEEVLSNLGAAKNKLEYLEKLDREINEKKKKLVELIKEKAIFEELAFAFSKKGIQAMIIEQAIPEIEEETNELLAKMTDRAMQVKLLTQKETKTTGEVIETLDIKISDEKGEREYNLYSGGEAFRIDFALRIALSKLLARRAGAKLQFLVIDEGFGTQDAQGLTRLVEAINSISSDFAKIIVVTHLEELKDAFPVRIDVDRDEGGSHINIVG